MFIYIADEGTVSTGRFNHDALRYETIRIIEESMSLSDAVAKFETVTFWRTRAGR